MWRRLRGMEELRRGSMTLAEKNSVCRSYIFAPCLNTCFSCTVCFWSDKLGNFQRGLEVISNMTVTKSVKHCLDRNKYYFVFLPSKKAPHIIHNDIICCLSKSHIILHSDRFLDVLGVFSFHIFCVIALVKQSEVRESSRFLPLSRHNLSSGTSPITSLAFPPHSDCEVDVAWFFCLFFRHK